MQTDAQQLKKSFAKEVITKYCDQIFNSGAETEEFFYRLGLKDGLHLKAVVKKVIQSLS